MVRDKLFPPPGVRFMGTEPSEWTRDLALLEVSGSGLGHTRPTGFGSVLSAWEVALSRESKRSPQLLHSMSLTVQALSEATQSSANRG